MPRIFFVLLSVVLCWSCTTPQGGFSGRSLHEKYADGIEKAGLKETAMGAQWLAAATRSLQQPVSITIPYKETGYFAADRPAAVSYRFSLQRGERVRVSIQTVPAKGSLLFAELWEPRQDREPAWLAAADTLSGTLDHEIEKDGQYILRIQPELLRGIEYTISITTAPSLAFPVRASDNPKVSSFWGADRDAGARSHEGIDIFARFRTPVVAASDGTVTRVNENNLGGKVVFMRPDGKDYNLYYAHLDTQLVRPGQEVRVGETLGLMGNTGNARTTPPHLHFGIYTGGGAINPYPFVNVNRASSKNISANTAWLNEYVRSKAAMNVYTSPSASAAVLVKSPASAIMQVTGATDNWYRVLLPDGSTGFVNSTHVATGPLRKQYFRSKERLLDLPDSSAAARLIADADQPASILGRYNGFYLVEYKDTRGWVPVTRL